MDYEMDYEEDDSNDTDTEEEILNKLSNNTVARIMEMEGYGDTKNLLTTIEEKTRDQEKTRLWWKLKIYRLSASLAGRLGTLFQTMLYLAQNEEKDVESLNAFLVNNIFQRCNQSWDTSWFFANGINDLPSWTSTLGHKSETYVIKTFIPHFLTWKYPLLSFTIQRPGLMFLKHPKNICASLDGIISFPDYKIICGLEIKTCTKKKFLNVMINNVGDINFRNIRTSFIRHGKWNNDNNKLQFQTVVRDNGDKYFVAVMNNGSDDGSFHKYFSIQLQNQLLLQRVVMTDFYGSHDAYRSYGIRNLFVLRLYSNVFLIHWCKKTCFENNSREMFAVSRINNIWHSALFNYLIHKEHNKYNTTKV
jgi:hypothetical protein